MSQEFVFYPVIKKDGKYAPFTLNPEGEPLEIMWANARGRSSFLINCKKIEAEELGQSIKDYFNKKDSVDYLYVLPIDVVDNLSDGGLVAGYTTIEEAAMFYEDKSDVYLLPPELYADMAEEERKKYVKIAYIDVNSPGYICSVLKEFADTNFKYDIEFFVLHSY